MQVENIECQIAQAQIGNFLAGSGLSQEAMEQLEEHIAGCLGCKAVLSERRSELKALLTKPKAIVDFEKIAQEAEATQAKSISTALRKKSLQQMLEPTPEPVAEASKLRAVVDAPANDQEPKAAKKPSQWKPLIYSLALAAVLVGMSLFSKNITELFGPKLSAASPLTGAAPSPDPQPAPVETPSENGASTLAPTVVGISESPSPTTSEPSTPPVDETASIVAPSPVASVPSTPEPGLSEEESTVAAQQIGENAGALSATQFEAPVAPNPEPPVTPAPAKPVVAKAPAKKLVARRVVRRQPVRRTSRPAAKGGGIKVYNP